MSMSNGRELAGTAIHMLGIGGAGVSALALLARGLGAHVSGCDRERSSYLDRLGPLGVELSIGHDADHIAEYAPDVVVTTSAIARDHPELEAARDAGARVMLRGEFLGELTRWQRSIVVAGAHGKSTTTAMTWFILQRAGVDASCALGAEFAPMGGNAHMGDGPWLVAEGDESDRTLRHLAGEVAVITNIERDHHHTFASDEELESLFAGWVDGLDDDATLILGAGAALDRLAAAAGGRTIRFASDARLLERIAGTLNIPGQHNVLNAAAAVSACGVLGVDTDTALGALAEFPGIGRRFELVGEAAGVRVIDDYAHHPTEVAATIEAARSVTAGRVLCLFQPHLFSRTQALHKEFAAALAGADGGWILPIYAARETPIGGVSSALIAESTPDMTLLDADPRTDAAQIAAAVASEAARGDTILVMGAGSVTAVAPALVASLEAHPAASS